MANTQSIRKTTAKKSRTRDIFMRMRRSIWTFPLLLCIPLFLFTALGIHGSSIGVYYKSLYGSEARDPNLLYEDPKPIRSDEWLGSTQFTIRQHKIGYPAHDDGLGTGRDATKHPDSPVRDWVTLFRPHNWSFFVLPLENAFAMKWWLLAYLLIVSCYFFVLRILPGHKKLAALIGVAFALSPYILWWYQSALFMTLAYGFLIIILGMRIINQEKIPKAGSPLLSNGIYAALLTYLGACFGLLFYPPYSISIILVVSAFLLGYLLQKKFDDGLSWKRVGKRLLVFLIAAVVVMGLLVLFAIQHKEMIEKTAQAVYPGQRRSPSGALSFLAVFDGFLMPLLQKSSSATSYYTNQSGASNFILLLPFVLIPGIFIQIREYFKRKKIDWVFLGLNLCAVLFFVRSFVHFGDPFYKLLLLDRVPVERMIAGMGFLGIIYLVVLVKKLSELDIPGKILKFYSAGYGLVCVLVLFSIGRWVMQKYPAFLDDTLLMMGFILLFTSIIVAFLANMKYVGAVLLLIFSFGSSFKILPLYRGLDIATDSEVIQRIDAVSQPGERWITTDDISFLNFPAMAGEDQIGGSQSYPDSELWNQISGGKFRYVYNRQARAVFVSNEPDMEEIELVQKNYFRVKFECSEFIYKNVDFVLAVRRLNYKCVEFVEMVDYPAKDFFIYRVRDKN